MREIHVFAYATPLEVPQGKSRIHILRTPSPLDNFQTEVVETGKKKVLFITSDVSLLFNQQRLSQLNPMILEQLVGNLKKAKPQSNLTDEQLIGALKSRYIQSNADVYAWTRAVQADLDNTISSIEAEAAALEAEKAEGSAVQESGE